jgi:hypothetical protein
MKKALLAAFAALACVLAPLGASPAHANDVNEITRTVDPSPGNCTFDVLFGNFGSTPYATSRLFSNASGHSCLIEHVAVYEVLGPFKTSEMALFNPPYNTTGWHQVNGDDSWTAWGIDICIEDVTATAVRHYQYGADSLESMGVWRAWGTTDCSFKGWGCGSSSVKTPETVTDAPRGKTSPRVVGPC